MKKYTRLYKCSRCTHVSSHDTLDSRDFISQCDRCNGIGPQRCLECDTIEVTLSRRECFPLIRTRVHFFSKEKDVIKAANEYRIKPAILALQSSLFEFSPPVSSGEVWLDSERLFDDTWAVSFDSPTHALMQLDPFCAVYKDSGNSFCYGYLIEPTKEMQQVRKHTPYCGRCGQSAENDAIFCIPCLTSTPFTFKRCQMAKLSRRGEQLPLTQTEYIAGTLITLKSHFIKATDKKTRYYARFAAFRQQHQLLVLALYDYLLDENILGKTPPAFLLENMARNQLFLTLLRQEIRISEAGQDVVPTPPDHVALI